MSRPAALMGKVIEETLSSKDKTDEKIGYIHPSSLAKGCMLYVARELLGVPKEEPDSRVKRILNAGTSGHWRIARYFSRVTLAREAPFTDEEHRIRGRCDAIVYLPPELDPKNNGFYAVEIKTVGSTEYGLIKGAKEPKPEHRMQCLIYIWGIRRYYKSIPLRGGIVYYEDRDTLDYLLFDVEYEEEKLQPLLERVKAILPGLKEGRLPEDHLPPEHWVHGYCPYLSICEHGQKAVRSRKKAGIPDRALADLIAKRIVSKRGSQGGKGGSKRAQRSLEELASQLNWEQVTEEKQGLSR